MKLKDLPDMTLDKVLGNIRFLVDYEKPELSEALERYYRFLMSYGDSAVNQFLGQFLIHAPLYQKGTEMKPCIDMFVTKLKEEVKYSLYFWASVRLYDVQFTSPYFGYESNAIQYSGAEMDFFFENGNIAKDFYKHRFCLVSIN
ncbi:MAG: hypothetical protein WCO58_01800 [bacterium]